MSLGTRYSTAGKKGWVPALENLASTSKPGRQAIDKVETKLLLRAPRVKCTCRVVRGGLSGERTVTQRTEGPEGSAVRRGAWFGWLVGLGGADSRQKKQNI